MTRPRRDGGGKTLRHRLAEEEEKKSLIHSDKIWAPMNEENKKKKILVHLRRGLHSVCSSVSFCLLLWSSSG